MKVGDLKSILTALPDEMELWIVNPFYEWYGAELMDAEAWTVVENKLVFCFANEKTSVERIQNELPPYLEAPK